MIETYESILNEDIASVQLFNQLGFEVEDYPSDSLSIDDIQALHMLDLLGFNGKDVELN